MKFDEETSVTRVVNNHYLSHVYGSWNIGDNPNGGYLVSIASAALAEVLPHPDPVSVTTHFLRPGSSDEDCEIKIDVIRTGRTMSTARATLSQQGKERIVVMAAFADLSQPAGIDAKLTMPPPDLPTRSQCVERTGAIQGVSLPITTRLKVLLDPELAAPGKSESARMAGWIGFVDDREPDSRCLALFTDAFPPSPLSRLGPIGWVPTLELTVHVIRRPALGPVQAHFQTNSLHEGRMIESGALWDSEGQLVAQSRQLGLVIGNT
jgi:acyl-CoA thioesterase